RNERGSSVTLAGSPRPVPGARTADDDGEADPVIAEGAPRSFRVVNVPIPAEFRGVKGPIEYSVVSAGPLKILGARQGSIAPASTKHDAIFTIAISHAAYARRVAVGYVTFSAAGMAAIRVPVNLDVSSVHRLTVEA